MSNGLDSDQDWRSLGTDALSILIWVLTICKDYQQTTKVAASKERGNHFAIEQRPLVWVYCYIYSTNKDDTLLYCLWNLPFEPVHEISNNGVCATSKGLDQPAQVAWVLYEC